MTRGGNKEDGLDRLQTPVMVFPGQGAQKVGMGESFRTHPVYRAHLAEADDVLGLALSRLIAAGPAETLQRTDRAQLALLTVATGIYRVWRAEGFPLPAAVAGHSLGEYTALVAAEALSFAAALQLVRLRGEAMQTACAAVSGGMLAVIRPQLETIHALCQASHGAVTVANFNSPQQIVLSGESTALAGMGEQIRSQNLGRPIPLKVAGAFHSRWMEPARAALTEAIAAAPLQDPVLPVVMNVTAESCRRAGDIRRLLAQQLTAPVRWSDCVLTLAGTGATFVEPGPATLAPLIRQIAPQARTLRLEQEADLAVCAEGL